MTTAYDMNDSYRSICIGNTWLWLWQTDQITEAIKRDNKRIIMRLR